MIATERFEHAFWSSMLDDAEGTLQRVRSLRQELSDSIAADKIFSRSYPGTDSTSTRANEDLVATIDKLLAENDELDEVEF